MKRQRMFIVAVMALLAPAAGADAQQSASRKEAAVIVAAAKPVFQAIEAAPVESISLVKNAPFFAEAVTEFTQTLGNGNRIERRYVSSIARDSRGRTRREEEIALVGPFAATGPSPKLVTIVDPDLQVSYTLDEQRRVAYQNGVAPKLFELVKIMETARGNVKPAGGGGRGLTVMQQFVEVVGSAAGAERKKVAARETADPAATTVVMESLGARTIEGVSAEGTRTTSTIPAGAIGNLLPIEIVSERWFSPELQMAVMITRSDPRAGETVYRLTNIVRAEPHEALFTVPPDYELLNGSLGSKLLKMSEAKKGAPKK